MADILKNTTGITLTAGPTSTSQALPMDRNGRSSSVVRVTALTGAAVHVNLGMSGVTASASNLLIIGGQEVALDISGKSHIAVIQAGLSLGGLVNVVPYE